MSGIIHDVSSTGATVFVEPQAVVEANARILQYRAQEAQEIERILVAFTGQVAAIEPQFQYSYKAMLEIDVLLAKARLALDMKAFKPTVGRIRRSRSSGRVIRSSTQRSAFLSIFRWAGNMIRSSSPAPTPAVRPSL